MARAVSGSGHAPGTPSRSPVQVVGAQVLGLSPAALRGASEKGAGLEAEQPGLVPELQHSMSDNTR